MEISIKAIWFQNDRIFIRTASGEVCRWSGFPDFTMLPWQSASGSSFLLLGSWPELDEDLSFEGFFTYSKQPG